MCLAPKTASGALNQDHRMRHICSYHILYPGRMPSVYEQVLGIGCRSLRGLWCSSGWCTQMAIVEQGVPGQRDYHLGRFALCAKWVGRQWPCCLRGQPSYHRHTVSTHTLSSRQGQSYRQRSFSHHHRNRIPLHNLSAL